MPIFTNNKRQLKILTLASKTQYEDGRYVLSFDVLKHSDHEKIKAIRGKENQVYEELDCIAAPCSGEVEMDLKEKKCQFTFTVSGALKPSSKLEKGEDVLEYNESLSESRRLLHLTPTLDKASEGMAYIKFWVDKTVKHTVTICDVPVEKTKTMSSSTLSRHSSDGSSLGLSQTSVKYADEEDHTTVDGGFVQALENVTVTPTVSVNTLRNATVRTSGQATSPDKNQAKPLDARPTQGPTYLPAAASADCDDEDEGAVGGESAYDKILTNASLQCLAWVLPPQDSQTLLIHLQVPNNVIEQKKKDHPGDIVSAMFHCFLYWRGEKRKSVQLNQDTNKHLYNDLITELETIRRRDIKSTIMKSLDDNKELKKGDFKHL